MKEDTKMNNNKFDLFEDVELTKEDQEFFKYSSLVDDIIIKLISRRLELNMSQRDLAQKSGIKQPMIARIEKFESVPRLDTIVKMAYALNLNVSFVETNNNINPMNLGVLPDEYNKKIEMSKENNIVLCDNKNKYNSSK
jgi:transcriptional regulator with XRE-family HTH domain